MKKDNAFYYLLEAAANDDDNDDLVNGKHGSKRFPDGASLSRMGRSTAAQLKARAFRGKLTKSIKIIVIIITAFPFPVRSKLAPRRSQSTGNNTFF